MISLSPMMSHQELRLLEKHLSTNDIVCEYGSGGSTSWLSKRVKNVFSIEHNDEWYKKTNSTLTELKNVNLYLVPNSKNWNPATEGTYEDFKEYIHFPLELNASFTFFLVDGRARVECCKFISENYPKSVVAFHDYTNRANDLEHNYSKALAYLDIVETADTLAIFKTKSK